MNIFTALLYFVVGLLVGVVVGFILSFKKPSGYLRIDRSDKDDAPYLFLELSESVEKVSENEYVILKIKKENFISQK